MNRIRQVKRQTYAGAIYEVEIYSMPDGTRGFKNPDAKLRFKSEEERAAHKLGISRRNHLRLFQENFSPRSLYSTLTFDDDNEVHTFEEARHIRDLYCRRLRYAFPQAVIFFYLGRGRNTHRIHMHMVSNDVPKEAILAQWRYGTIVSCENLREHNYYEENGRKVDHGQDYAGLANYLFDHWTPEQGGHRWKMTRNAKRPAREDPVPLETRYYSFNRPPIAPKGYTLIETKRTSYGYLYFKYVAGPLERYPSRRKELDDQTSLFDPL